MSYISRYSKTVTLSTVGAYTGYTDTLVGRLLEVEVLASTSAGSNSKVTLTSTSTGQEILVMKDPTIVGQFFWPHYEAQGTTGAAIPAAGAESHTIPLVNRIRINVASSSAFAAETVTLRFKLDGPGVY